MRIGGKKRYGPEFDSAELIEGLWHVDGQCERELFDEEIIEAFEQQGDGFPLDQWIRNEFLQRAACPFCGQRLGKARHEIPGYTSDDDGLFELWSCVRCGFWQWHALQAHGDLWSSVSTPVTRTFDPTLPEGCQHELAQHLIRDPDKWHSLHPTALEKFTGEISRANYAHADVIHVGGPGDLGVDVVFIESSGREWLIQVKRRRKGSSEGFSTLQKLLSTLLLKGGRHGIIATTADHFTHAVHKQVGRAAELGVTVQLLDKGKLARMIGTLIQGNSWMEHLPGLFPFSFLKPHEQRDLVSALGKLLPHPRQGTLFDNQN